jgi:transcriptional regulator with XRE-family HTH domain
MENVNARVLLVIDKMGFKKGELASKLGVSAALITHIYSGRNKAGLDLIQKLLLEFPELDERWLLLGEGDMIKANKGPSVKDLKGKIELIKDRIKLQQHASYDLGKMLDDIINELGS